MTKRSIDGITKNVFNDIFIEGVGYLFSTSNQLVFGGNGNNTTTINVNIPSAPRTYTIPDIGADGTFYISGNSQPITGSLIPSANNTYSIGSSTYGWEDLYITGSAYLEGNNLQFNGPTSSDKTYLIARNTPGSGSSEIFIPSVYGTMCIDSATQTLSNKTLYAPIFDGPCSGVIQTISQYCFKAYNNVGQTGVTGAGEQYTIIFDTVDFQVGTGYDSSTGVFTAPIAGLYHFTANIQTGGWTTSNTAVACWFYHNTTKYNMHMTNNISFPTGYLVSNFSTTFNMASGDYITVGIEVNGSSTANISIISGSMNTNLIGYLLVAIA